MSYTKIKTMPSVLKANGLTAEDLKGIQANFEKIAKKLPQSQRAKYVAFKMIEFNMELMVSAINEGWVANWADKNQYKYYPWWWVVDKKGGVSGCGLSLDDVLFDYTGATVAPHLVFESREKAAHAAKYFLKLYEMYYLGEK